MPESAFRAVADESPVAVAAAIGALADRSAAEGPWRSGAFAELARHGVLAGFVPAECGGTAAGEPALLELLAAIAERCLTTALALTQWAAAVRIIATGPTNLRERRLPALARGDTFTTVGISQLTTSRQHVGTPALEARTDRDGWRLDGLCPWVTGADCCDTIVTGAATPAGDRMFFVLETSATGLTIDPPLDMLALSGSRTAAVRFAAVRPADTIPPEAAAPRTGGLATTALAVGSTKAALAVLEAEAGRRPDLAGSTAALAAETARLEAALRMAATTGDASARDRLRVDANGLVTRAAQAALTAAKGAGFVRGHPAERIARESLFFLVWSCPQSVSAAVLCDLAGTG